MKVRLNGRRNFLSKKHGKIIGGILLMLLFGGAACLLGARAQTTLPNLALNKTFTASSSIQGNEAKNAGDGSQTTRWESNHDDGEWIYVDLGSVHSVGCVKIQWEAAYAASYEIQYSADAQNWKTCWSTTDGKGNLETDAFQAVNARYIKMNGLKRATVYGYSIYEFQVYETPADSAPSVINVTGSCKIAIPSSGQTTAQYTALVSDQYGLPMSGQALAWSIQPETAGVSIDQNGMVTVTVTAKTGTVHIAAKAGNGATGSCQAKLTAETPIDLRIDAIMSKMTLQDKIEQMYGASNLSTGDNTSLGIPGFRYQDTPRGVRVDDGWPINGKTSTSFPCGISMASTWDPALIEQVSSQIAKEARAHGANQGLGPTIDLLRDPRAGRAQESGGEDPYLDSKIGVSYVNGYQRNSLIATIKHYNLNTMESYVMDRGSTDDTVDDRTLIEFYGAPFRAAVQQANAMSVMSAYNKINGQYCSSSNHLLSDILRRLFGFRYEVVTDWGALHDGESGATSSLDVEMPSGDNFKKLLASDAIKNPAVLDGINNAVRDILRTKIVSGMLDGQPAADASDINSSAAKSLALETAEKSIVLLKNANSILPLDSAKIKSVALIGPSAKVAQMGDHGSSNVNASYSVTPYDGLNALIGSSVKINYAKGCDIDSTSTSGFADAVAAAKDSDVVVYVGGLDWNEEGEGHDRTGGSIDLPGKQQELINQLASVNSNVVVVLEGGAPIGISKCVDSIKGLLMAWYPGQEGGNAVANVLLGKYNPGGKLVATFPVNDSQLPAWTMDFTKDLTDGRGYRWYDTQNITPLYPFGYGLSYTTFSMSNLTIDKASIGSDEKVKVTADVQNTGNVAGDEIPQLYLKFPDCGVKMAPKQLKGFQRVTLQPGEKKTVTFTLTPDDLSYYDVSSSEYKVALGKFNVMAGTSSRDLPLSGSFAVSKTVDTADLDVSEIAWTPERTVLNGDTVAFAATVENIGKTATGTPVKVNFYVDGAKVASGTSTESLAPDGQVTIKADTGYKAVTGAHQIKAVVNEDASIREANDSNNSAERILTAKVYSGQVPLTVKTLIGTAPVLPGSVTLSYTDGTSVMAPVKWDAVKDSSYAAAGTFTVSGTVQDIASVQATVQVVSFIPKIYEFESDFALSGGVKANTDHYGYTGTGFTDMWGEAGAQASLDITEQSAGSATIVLRYANGASDGNLNFYVNGVKQSKLRFPAVAAGDWGKWGTISIPVTLSAGKNTISFRHDSDNANAENLDNLTIQDFTATSSSVPSSAPDSSQPVTPSSTPSASQPVTPSSAPTASQPGTPSEAAPSGVSSGSSLAAGASADNGSAAQNTSGTGSHKNPFTGDLPFGFLLLPMFAAGAAVITLLRRKK